MLSSLLLLLSLLQLPGTTPGSLPDWTAHPLIAHAMGAIDGTDLTNSREAFETNYARGFRVFETDLMLTKDRKALVARHDWEKKLFERFGQDQFISVPSNWNPISLEEFIQLPILNRYSSMTYKDLLELMVKYPDIYFVLDTKFTDEPTIRTQFRLIVDEASEVDARLLNRIIPQLYNRQMLGTIESIHKFPSYIYTLYLSKDTNDEVVDFVKAHPRIRAVAMPGYRAKKSFVQSLKQAGAVTFVHTINDMKALKQYEEAGVRGVYTDSIGYGDLAKGLMGAWMAPPPLALE